MHARPLVGLLLFLLLAHLSIGAGALPIRVPQSAAPAVRGAQPTAVSFQQPAQQPTKLYARAFSPSDAVSKALKQAGNSGKSSSRCITGSGSSSSSSSGSGSGSSSASGSSSSSGSASGNNGAGSTSSSPKSSSASYPHSCPAWATGGYKGPKSGSSIDTSCHTPTSSKSPESTQVSSTHRSSATSSTSTSKSKHHTSSGRSSSSSKASSKSSSKASSKSSSKASSKSSSKASSKSSSQSKFSTTGSTSSTSFSHKPTSSNSSKTASKSSSKSSPSSATKSWGSSNGPSKTSSSRSGSSSKTGHKTCHRKSSSIASSASRPTSSSSGSSSTVSKSSSSSSAQPSSTGSAWPHDDYTKQELREDLRKIMKWAYDTEQLQGGLFNETVDAVWSAAARYWNEVPARAAARIIISDMKAESDFDNKMVDGPAWGLMQVTPGQDSNELDLFRKHATVKHHKFSWQAGGIKDGPGSGALTDYQSSEPLDVASLKNRDLLRPWINVHVASWIQSNLARSGSNDPYDWQEMAKLARTTVHSTDSSSKSKAQKKLDKYLKATGLPYTFKTALGSWLAGPATDGHGSYAQDGDNQSEDYFGTVMDGVRMLYGKSGMTVQFLNKYKVHPGFVDYNIRALDV